MMLHRSLALLLVVVACKVTEVSFTPLDSETGSVGGMSKADGERCAGANECRSGVCAEDACAAPTCTDTVKNGTEIDVDCGGSCGACADGKACDRVADCASGICTAGACAAATCSDTVKNGTEADVDCGGSCGACADGEACGRVADCTSGVCTGNVCQVPACPDGVANGTETDVDCGGSCAIKCALGKRCRSGPDCATGTCTGGVCVSAADCASNLKWQRVNCTTTLWVWSSNRSFTSLAAANTAKVLETGCAHGPVPNTCSTDGLGWVSTQVFTMAGCDTNWLHLTPQDTSFACGGHDGDQYRHLSRDDNSCYDY